LLPFLWVLDFLELSITKFSMFLLITFIKGEEKKKKVWLESTGNNGGGKIYLPTKLKCQISIQAKTEAWKKTTFVLDCLDKLGMYKNE
jgi:hypothetical protein